jgi:hypothetical protein
MRILVSAFIIIGLCVMLGIALFISIFNWMEENVKSLSLRLLIAFVSIGIIPISLSYLLCYIIF